MPEINASVTTSWSDGSSPWASVTTSWREGVTLWASLSSYPMPEVPPGGTVAYPTPATVTSTQIEAADVYQVAYTLASVDTRDDTPLEILSAQISTDEDSSVWSLRAVASAATFGKLTSGVQPATIEITANGLTWAFVIDSVSRSRAHNSTNVTVTGRSITAAAGAPFQAEQNWVNVGATTGAQLSAIANLYTGVGVVWEIDDWIIPDQVFTMTGTPLAVVRRVADAAGAVVRSDRKSATLYVSPRYPTLPNEWPVIASNVTVAWEAVETESYERTDRPEYTGVYLSGQQGGLFGYVHLNGTNGATLHPFVTDLLLTDVPALRQRGTAILGSSGQQARQTITLPVLTAPGQPGVVDLGYTVRVMDPAGDWVGICRSVSVQIDHGRMRQTLTLERHTKLIEGTAL